MAEIVYQVLQKPIEERLIDAACIYWDVERASFREKTKRDEVMRKKSILYYLIKTQTELSYQSIADLFGFKGHMPVMRLIENIDARKDITRQISNDISQISAIASKLDAQFITTGISLVNNNIQKELI